MKIGITKSPVVGLFVQLILKNWKLGLLGFIPNCIAAFFEVSSFAFVLVALSCFDQKSLPLNLSWLNQISFVSKLMQGRYFLFFLIFAIFFQILRSFFCYIGELFVAKMSALIQSHFQKSVVDQVLKMAYPTVCEYKAGELIDFCQIPQSVTGLIFTQINRMLIAGLILLVGLGFLLSLSISLTLKVIFLFGSVAYGLKFINKKLRNYSVKLTNSLTELGKHVVQSIEGLRLIHIYNKQQFISEFNHKTLESIKKLTLKLCAWSLLINPLNEIFTISIVAFLLVFGSITSNPSSESVMSLLLTFILVLYRMASRFQQLMQAKAALSCSFGVIQKLEFILCHNRIESLEPQTIPLTHFCEKIEFKNVSLRYSGQKNFSLKNLSFTLKKNQTLALVGFSGSGKSSILDLLTALYRPTAGEIWIDGHPLSQIKIESWRSLLGVVSQDVFIFNETLMENIRFGSEGISADQVIWAAQLAGVEEFVSTLPKGYQTIVGERGFKLSGGQRQRISLARALVRKPQILILDEATSHLDSYSEHLVLSSLERIQHQMTLLMVAHRLSTVMKADQILVLNQGVIEASGTHQSLIQEEGHYSRLWKLQTESEDSRDRVLSY